MWGICGLEARGFTTRVTHVNFRGHLAAPFQLYKRERGWLYIIPDTQNHWSMMIPKIVNKEPCPVLKTQQQCQRLQTNERQSWLQWQPVVRSMRRTGGAESPSFQTSPLPPLLLPLCYWPTCFWMMESLWLDRFIPQWSVASSVQAPSLIPRPHPRGEGIVRFGQLLE